VLEADVADLDEFDATICGGVSLGPDGLIALRLGGSVTIWQRPDRPGRTLALGSRPLRGGHEAASGEALVWDEASCWHFRGAGVQHVQMPWPIGGAVRTTSGGTVFWSADGEGSDFRVLLPTGEWTSVPTDGTSHILGAAPTSAGGWISWAADGSAQCWSESMRPVGSVSHSREVLGARELSSGMLLSWSAREAIVWPGQQDGRPNVIPLSADTWLEDVDGEVVGLRRGVPPLRFALAGGASEAAASAAGVRLPADDFAVAETVSHLEWVHVMLKHAGSSKPQNDKGSRGGAAGLPDAEVPEAGEVLIVQDGSDFLIDGRRISKDEVLAALERELKAQEVVVHFAVRRRILERESELDKQLRQATR
jgi:hypothetical protein